jgi:hypothetical protein
MQNSDFWRAIRGGGTSYGFVVEWIPTFLSLPCSVLIPMQWNDSVTRFDVARKFFNYTLRARSTLTSRVNMFKTGTRFSARVWAAMLPEL